MIVKKSWGYEDVVVLEPEYTLKFLHIASGWRCSTHCHKVKKETFVIHHGSCIIALDNGMEFVAHEGEKFTIHPNEYHFFGVPKGWPPCVILEVSTHHSDDDVYRKSPSQPFEEVDEYTPYR